ncbi:PREDICTED: odorant receptor 30a-like [Atta cephalotes]|uniref:Odorant receptor n=1 Tax=Atta cephalotes TaxID=12957 RepID=A0A158P072_ATTCE|nr:PREDICTED: odorant receptor 30a-like [Atta cephalotes]
MQVIWNTFIICSLGFIIIISNIIANAAYESLWYDLLSNQKKTIIFIIMRSQKQIMITAGKITSLSLETFTSILKASASYVSVLHAMY